MIIGRIVQWILKQNIFERPHTSDIINMIQEQYLLVDV